MRRLATLSSPRLSCSLLLFPYLSPLRPVKSAWKRQKSTRVIPPSGNHLYTRKFSAQGRNINVFITSKVNLMLYLSFYSCCLNSKCWTCIKLIIMKPTNVQWFAFCPLVRATLPHRLAGMAFNCLLFVGAGLLLQRQVLQGKWV